VVIVTGVEPRWPHVTALLRLGMTREAITPTIRAAMRAARPRLPDDAIAAYTAQAAATNPLRAALPLIRVAWTRQPAQGIPRTPAPADDAPRRPRPSRRAGRGRLF
jgi:hypothetical protein